MVKVLVHFINRVFAIQHWIAMSLSKFRNGNGGGKTLPARYMRLMQWNIGGVRSEIFGNKLEDPDFLSTIAGHDLIAMTETHASDDVKMVIQ